jgi:hypothetical protein
MQLWSETWRAPEAWAEAFESTLRSRGMVVRRGGVSDPWDLEIRGGLQGSLRTRIAFEEHGAGKQLVRLRADAHTPVLTKVATWGAAALAFAAVASGGWIAAVVLAAAAAGLAWRTRSDQNHARDAWSAACARVASRAQAAGPVA